MVEAAITGEEGLEISLIEESHQGPSYTVELLRRLRAALDGGLYLIMGADSVADLPNWREPESIVKLATLVVFPRTGYSSVVPMDEDAAIVLFEDPVIDISSTEIREGYRRGDPPIDLLPKAVHKFILDNSLYT
jgi:nicotinate-nucleotide adenylyltransferase